MAKDNLAIANANSMAIRSLHDFQFKPSVLSKLYKTYGKGFTLVDMFRKAAGRSDMVSNETLTAEEENFTLRTIKLASNSSGGVGPGDEITFALHADDLDSDGNYYPRENFTVQFGDVVNGFIQTRITDITVTGGGATVTLTCKPYDSTKTLGTIASGTEVAVMDSAFAAETGQPNATSIGSVEREFYAQIMKESIGFGGMELAKQKWVNKEGIGLFNAELARAEFMLDVQEEMALIMGQPNTNSITQTSNTSGKENTVYKNKGIWTWIDELGGEITFTTASGMEIEDLDETAEYFESVGITDDIVFFGMGGKLLRGLENNAVDYFQGSGNLTDEFTKVDKQIFGGQAGMTLDIGFKAVKKGGILFLMQKMPVFSNPYLLGISGYKLENSGMMFPLSNVKDKKTGSFVPNLMAKYVGINGYSRKRVIGMLGGMDGFMKQRFQSQIVSQFDENNTYWLSHVMFPFLEAYKGIIVRPAT